MPRNEGMEQEVSLVGVPLVVSPATALPFTTRLPDERAPLHLRRHRGRTGIGVIAIPDAPFALAVEPARAVDAIHGAQGFSQPQHLSQRLFKRPRPVLDRMCICLVPIALASGLAGASAVAGVLVAVVPATADAAGYEVVCGRVRVSAFAERAHPPTLAGVSRIERERHAATSARAAIARSALMGSQRRAWPQ